MNNQISGKVIMLEDGNHFIQSEFLGKGSSGLVNRCIFCKVEYAVKRIEFSPTAYGDEDNFKSMIAKEFKILSTFNCKWIIKAHHYFFKKEGMTNVAYIFYEICHGGSLESLIDKGETGKWGYNDIIKFMLNLLKGIQYLNNLNVVHRDLKPSNILFKEKMEKDIDKFLDSLTIIDFFFARYDDGKSKTFCGTQNFMAPEIFKENSTENSKKSKYDKQVDIWASGVILYILMYNKYPYDSRETRKDNQVIQIEFKENSENGNAWKKPLIDICRSMLRENPSSRGDLDILIEDLEQLNKDQANLESCYAPKSMLAERKNGSSTEIKIFEPKNKNEMEQKPRIYGILNNMLSEFNEDTLKKYIKNQEILKKFLQVLKKIIDIYGSKKVEFDINTINGELLGIYMRIRKVNRIILTDIDQKVFCFFEFFRRLSNELGKLNQFEDLQKEYLDICSKIVNNSKSNSPDLVKYIELYLEDDI